MYNYTQARNEKVSWLPVALPLGTDEHGQPYEVVGVSHSLPLCLLESLIIQPVLDTRAKGAVLLGRARKFNPWFNLFLNEETLKVLSEQFGLLTRPSFPSLALHYGPPLTAGR